jgi:hypothetical protein
MRITREGSECQAFQALAILAKVSAFLGAKERSSAKEWDHCGLN